MKTNQITLLVVLALGSMSAPSLRAQGIDRAAMEKQIGTLIEEQSNALNDMRCLSGGCQDSSSNTSEEHWYSAYFREGLEVVIERHREDGITWSKDYHLKDGKVIAMLLERAEPCPDPSQKRVTFSGYGFHDGKLFSHSVSSMRINAEAEPDRDVMAKKERDLPIRPGFETFQQTITRQALEIARNLHPLVAKHPLGDFVQVGPSKDNPPLKASDGLPSKDTLTVPIYTWDLDSPELLSPDGRFGISWGYSKGPVDWAKLKDTSSGTYTIFELKEPTDSFNGYDTYLRNASTGELLGALDVGHRGSRARYNHREIVPYWSPSETIMVIRETDRNWDEIVRICWLNEESKIGINQDLLGPLGSAVLLKVQKSKHPASKNATDSEQMPIAIRGMDIDDDGTFQARVTGDNTRHNPNVGPADYFAAIVTGQVTPGKSGEPAIVTVKTMKLEPPLKDF